MKKLIVALLVAATIVPAHARLSEGEAALIGGIIGYAIRDSRTYPVQPPVVQYQHLPPVYHPPVVYQRQLTAEEHCEQQTHFQGQYNPGLARTMCFDQLNRMRWELQQIQRSYR